jgi:biopolymer transport protein ExbD
MTAEAYALRSQRWYVGLSAEQILELAASGDLEPSDWVRGAPDEPWECLDDFERRLHATGQQPPNAAPAPDTSDADIDMTPMIDMTFLLLIFFMVTASYRIQKSLDFPPSLTRSTSARAVGDVLQEALLLRIQPDDRYSLLELDPVSKQLRERPLDRLQLRRELEELKAKRAPRRLIIDASDDSSHGALVAALDAGHQAGFTDIRLASPPPPSASGR